MGGILCIFDGMTDGGFFFADYPYFSRCLASGAQGLLETTPPGRSPESLGCILTLTGVPADELGAFSRGWIEALGQGVPFDRGDLLVRTTCVALDGAGRIGEATAQPETAEPGLHRIGSYQGLLVVPGAAQSLADIETFPPYEHPGAFARDLVPRGSALLRDFTLRNITADRALIPWGQAAPGQPRPKDARICFVCGAPIVRGIARALGADLVVPPGATGDVDTDLAAKLTAALAAARTHEFVVLHLNGADEASHRRDRAEKAAFLRRADEIIVRGLLTDGGPALLCADHGADPATGAHLGGPQPFLLLGTRRRGAIGTFCGTSARRLLTEEN